MRRPADTPEDTPSDAPGEAASDRAALGALAADGRLAELGRYVPPLSLARAFGVGRDEVRHSRALAEVLDPARHVGAETILRPLLREVGGRLSSHPRGAEGAQTAEMLGKIAAAPFRRVSVRRESMLIDVVVEVSGPAGRAAVGIENKIDAGEQPDQLSRYQATLALAYPDHAAAMLFLTPAGRAPTTAEASHRVPVVPIGYGWLAEALSGALRATPPGGAGGSMGSARERDARVLRELRDHVKEEILGEGEPGPKELVRELWRDHGRALGLAVRYRPRLSDFRDAYVAALENRFPDARFDFFRRKGELVEVKMNLRSWDRAGFPFTFILHAWEGERPQVRALVWRDSYRKRAGQLSGWAREANASLGPDAAPVFDGAFTPVARWTYWHRVFLEEDYPASAEVGDQSFDADTTREAVGAVIALVELLRPHVEGHAEGHVEARPGSGLDGDPS